MYGYDGNLKRVKSVIDGQTIYNVYDLSGALVHILRLGMIRIPRIKMKQARRIMSVGRRAHWPA